MSTAEQLEEQLNSFDPDEREEALNKLAGGAAGNGGAQPAGASSRASDLVNMHFHSFFSYNAEGWSPSRIAWEARKAGLYAAGLCDFDVLDGLEEFLNSGLELGLRTCVFVETRAFVKDLAGTDINSPGEPGVAYVMGAGFARDLPDGSPDEIRLRAYRERAQTRNTALIERVNRHVPPIAIEYNEDVAPLTPAGAATERHIVSAYINKARSMFGHPRAAAEFWAGILTRDFEETVELLADAAALEEAVRAKLVKRGGLGYEKPSADSFPPIEDFMQWVRSCGAIPMMAWLDGTTEGESDAQKLLDRMAGKGALALNIIPERNWNVRNEAERKVKLANLKTIIRSADGMGMPVNIGTEMNKPGQPFADDLDCPALSPYREIFLRGARIMAGQCVLARYAGFSYSGDKAREEFPDVGKRNAFFEAVGRMPPVDRAVAESLEAMGEDKSLAWLRERA